MSLTRHIGSKVRLFRYQREWSQAKLALELQLCGFDLSRGAVSKIEIGARFICAEELLAIAQVLGKSPNDFYPSREENESARRYFRRIDPYEGRDSKT